MRGQVTAQAVYLNGRPLHLTDRIGAGLEAEVFRTNINGRLVAAKVFLTYDHPSFDGMPNERSLREEARNRLREHQRKLPALPRNLPQGILGLIDLLTGRDNQIAGYTMDLLPQGSESARLFADPEFRTNHDITNADIVPLLLDLHRIVREGHADGIIFGDAMSGNNVQFGNGAAWIIDGDSIVIPGFPSRTHTREVVDPQLCRPGELAMAGNKEHTQNSDWYVFNVLVAWLLTLVHPLFDGIYLVDDEMGEEERAHRGISTFRKDVKLPKAAIDPACLPDDLVAHLREVFEEGRRGEFPADLLDFIWVECSCGNNHGRATCNACGAPAPGSKVTRQGVVETTTLFTTPNGGSIVSVAAQGGKLHYAYVAGTDIHRENGSVVLADAMTSPDAQVVLSGNQTGVLDDTTLKVYAADGSLLYLADVAPGIGTIGANSRHTYWLRPDGAVLRTDPVDNKPKRLGVISGPRPRMWVGENFGIALWREVTGRIYVFDAEQPGLNSLQLPVVPGDLIDTHCVISSSVAWLMLTLQRGGNQYNYCYAINRVGEILASAEKPCNDGSWLGSGIRIHAVTGMTLYAPTPSGIVRVEITRSDGGMQFVARDPHANSAPHLQGANRLLLGDNGMIAVTTHNLTKLVNR